jgi:ADP-ribosyl-[dinitrogen reductase] hydrolase
MGERVRRHQMEWFHLPIPDVSVPDAAFEARWLAAGDSLRGVIRCGGRMLIHCKGGLGRSGMMAARVLVELGWDPEAAIHAVRTVRPGAIETRAQEQVVRRATASVEPAPDRSAAAIRDRAIGALLGLAVGDAIGTTLEFLQRDSYPPITGLVGGGPFHLEPGQWTDDTAMALALAASLLAHPNLDERDLMERFVAWWRTGEYSCTGSCFDIGNTISGALGRFVRTGEPVAGSTDPGTAGNGSLMRLSPVVVRHWTDRARLADIARRQGATTHGAAEAVDACAAFAGLLADAIAGTPKADVLARRADGYCPGVEAILDGSWRGKPRDAIRSTGYVIDSLEAAMWCVGRSTGFREAVLLAANLGHDADTVAAITGQLAGALWGASSIPGNWLAKLAWRERIEATAEQLFDASLTSAQAQAIFSGRSWVGN